MTDRAKNDSLKAFAVLMRSSQYVQESIQKSVAKFGLNTSEFGVLELLYHKGEQPIQNIGKKILLASSSMTYVIDRLEQKQLVTRTKGKTDRRVMNIAITDKGSQLMDEIFPLNQKDIEELFSVLEPEELKMYIQLGKKIGLHAKGINEK
ncbi:MarR family transcriptional regulator [Jeotgalibaca sp. MA1X17-3]|uniref:MarR family winged helix-turn-helix transcriptional regulator n=1 Tax=Jeotgalibaca sp. MA1X17-3 TaxID=2908211 RepID=UPI001F4389E2|nr:MarR family transcriptional regulator [Jeotgalibaca sp. MA1X17-3]UJF14615.1 MarR family transcriptional regulator [Jeotgalibaca sp. MA1X17-3]